MDLFVAVETGTVAILVLGASALVILVFLVIAPWRTIRQEPPIPEEAETRLLLGEDFEQVAHELESERGDGASVSDLDPGERHR